MGNVSGLQTSSELVFPREAGVKVQTYAISKNGVNVASTNRFITKDISSSSDDFPVSLVVVEN